MPFVGGGRVTCVSGELQAPFEGGGPVTYGSGESQERRSPSLIGQCFAPYSPILVAAQKACELEVYEMFSRTHVNKYEFPSIGDIITDGVFVDFYHLDGYKHRV